MMHMLCLGGAFNLQRVPVLDGAHDVSLEKPVSPPLAADFDPDVATMPVSYSVTRHHYTLRTINTIDVHGQRCRVGYLAPAGMLDMDALEKIFTRL